ncbi:MAG: alpha/beta hydrolase fold domain-containing protein [Proteobacteria bacterium]|nr:alpha/beta hydrolase fold domain-containing protein [Pseudomonadota bacterium]
MARVSRRNAKGFPLLLIQVGGAKALFDDTTRMISLLKEAGVAVKVAVWKDKAHVWDFLHICSTKSRKRLVKSVAIS